METYALKRGTGNRASFNGTVVTVFGGTGTLGIALVPALARIGCQIILPYRRSLQQAVQLKPSGDLGQFQFVVSAKVQKTDTGRSSLIDYPFTHSHST